MECAPCARPPSNPFPKDPDLKPRVGWFCAIAGTFRCIWRPNEHGGLAPTKKERKEHLDDFRLAIKNQFLGGVASRNLETVLLPGHSCDLQYLSCQRLLRALTKWRSQHEGNWLHKPSNVIRALNSALFIPHGYPVCLVMAWGVVELTPRILFLALLIVVGSFGALVKSKLGWLRATMMPSLLVPTTCQFISDELIAKLRLAATDMTAHEIGILCGAPKTDAKAPPPPTCCLDCWQRLCPDTFHVLWQCGCWEHLRRVPASRCLVVNRLGWGPTGVDLVYQAIVQRSVRIFVSAGQT